jgi:hypothetical protein
MHGLDVPALVCLLASAPRGGQKSEVRNPGQEEGEALPTYALVSPPLRYEVASLEHWLDLNA